MDSHYATTFVACSIPHVLLIDENGSAVVSSWYADGIGQCLSCAWYANCPSQRWFCCQSQSYCTNCPSHRLLFAVAFVSPLLHIASLYAPCILGAVLLFATIHTDDMDRTFADWPVACVCVCVFRECVHQMCCAGVPVVLCIASTGSVGAVVLKPQLTI